MDFLPDGKRQIKSIRRARDGYPRSESQAEAIEAEGIRPDVFIVLEVNVYYNALNYLSSICL